VRKAKGKRRQLGEVFPRSSLAEREPFKLSSRCVLEAVATSLFTKEVQCANLILKTVATSHLRVKDLVREGE